MKNKLLYSIGVVVLSFLISNTTFGQKPKYCGSTEMQNERYKNNPGLKALQDSVDEYQNEIANNPVKSPKSESMPPVYIIPVVFHVLHQWDDENISDAQILDAMRILNEDYRKLNADTIDIIPSFQTIATDAEFEFRLATIDPNGNCTNGIDRIATVKTNTAAYPSADSCKVNPWPRNKYLNIWTCKNMSGQVAGYAYKPDPMLPAYIDGVIILGDYIGSIGTGQLSYSHALSHEIGHFLGLDHPWGSTNQPGVSCGDDGIGDTPLTKGWDHCPLPQNAKICNVNVIENYQNFMDYSYCSNMYTLNQVAKMHLVINAATCQRNSLPSPANLTSTGTASLPGQVCAPEPYFNASLHMICVGASVSNFHGSSIKSVATSYSWSFPGGTPSSDTTQNPTIFYYTAGTYDVTLTVTNANGSNTITMPGVVVVSPLSGTYTAPIVEGFETNPFPGVWFGNDVGPGTSTWQRVNTAHHDVGSWCLKKDNYNTGNDGIDEFISPSLSFKWTSQVMLYFWRAFGLQSALNPTDKLRVLTTVNCGGLWSPKYTKTGFALSTAGVTSNFTPNTSTDWVRDTVNLTSTAVSGKDNVRIKFEYTYDRGDNLYIDDINITGIVGIDDVFAQSLDFNVYPNPAKSNATIHFNLERDLDLAICIYDVTGRKTDELVNQRVEAGEYEYEVQKELDMGVYFVKLQIGDSQLVKKLVVE